MKLSDERVNKHMQLVESYSHYMKLAERYGDKFGDDSGATAHWNMVRDDIRAIEREAYRNGQEAMRERAAKEWYPLHVMYDIRALKIEEPK